MHDIVAWISGSYSTIGMVVFFVCLIHEDFDFWISILLGIFWPFYVVLMAVKFAKNFLSK